jgi:hypothetical protein
MFRRFTVDIEFNQRQLIALPAVFAGRGIPVTPRAEGGEKMDSPLESLRQIRIAP